VLLGFGTFARGADSPPSSPDTPGRLKPFCCGAGNLFPSPSSGLCELTGLFPRSEGQSFPGTAFAPGDTPQEKDSGTTLKVDVKLVNLFVTVSDEHGSPVSNLKKENFQISEDGREQKISVFDRESAVPLSIVLAVDTSLSTRKDLPLEQASAKRFAHTIMRPVDGLSVYEFSEIVDEVVSFTSDLKRIDRGIDRLHMGAATALYDAVFLGARALEPRQGRKVMVVITDGGDTVSKMDYKDALRGAEEAEAIVYSIIIVPIEVSAGRDTGGEHALIQLSLDTGGKYFYASSLPQLDDAFRQISDELRTQYLLAYYPSQRYSESDFRKVQVTVSGVNSNSPFRVRHRAGYYTSKSPW
jgi:Ca-activated chloride channel homolog